MTHTANSTYSNATVPTKQKQYSLKAVLKQFGERGHNAVSKELTQLHTLKCFQPKDPTTLTRNERRKALTSLMLLTQKRTGEVKARGCADGSAQRDHIEKEEATAPTVASDSIF
jgi:hypothetical protein